MGHPAIHPTVAVIPHAVATFRKDRLPLRQSLTAKVL
jgi:hypothetical protein